MTEFDYLVVGGGGGTAGCIVAAWLAEDPAVSVGLVEWGPSDEHELRVADASVFPTIPSVNLMITVMLTAERAADLIRQDL